MKWLIGVDEVGRGPLAGPVTVCAGKSGSLPFGTGPVRDSKALSAKQREVKLKEFKNLRGQGSLEWRIASVSARVIDERGIVSAVHLAIVRALRALVSQHQMLPSRCEVLLDGGLRAPREYTNQRTIIRGDATVPIIAAASIIAKVHRDRLMIRLAARHPSWGFDKHKGYGTRLHYSRIKKHGLSHIHRRSFLGLSK